MNFIMVLRPTDFDGYIIIAAPTQVVKCINVSCKSFNIDWVSKTDGTRRDKYKIIIN